MLMGNIPSSIPNEEIGREDVTKFQQSMVYACEKQHKDNDRK